MSSICMYTPSSEGGHPRYTQELLTALSRHPDGGDYKFELVSGENLAQEFRQGPYPVHAILPRLKHRTELTVPGWFINRLSYYPRRDLAFLKWLRLRNDVAAVHFQEVKPWLAAMVFKRVQSLGIRVFATVHNVLPHFYPAGIPKWLMHSWLRRSQRLADGLFVHTPVLREELSRFLGPGHPPIHIVPHGVWSVAEPPAPVSMEERMSWKKLLFFGTLRPNKGLHKFLQAALELPGYSITIAGEVADEQYMAQEIHPQIKKLRDSGMRVDLQDRFIADEEVGRLFASHSAVVLPYTQQFVAQSGVVFMALAYELPVVAAEAGGLRDLFKAYRVGTTFPESTPADIAIGVRRLYSDGSPSELLKEIRAAKQHYSWHEAAGATLVGYKTALTNRNKPDVRGVATTTLAH